MSGSGIKAVLALVVAAVVWAAVPARAEGVTRIQQADGKTEVYRHVTIRVRGQTLLLSSSDRKGVLEVTSDACTYLAGLKRCLPYRTVYYDRGTAHTVVLEHGTVYTNVTDGPVQLPHSADRLGPHEVLVLLHTMRGTYLSVTGSVDQIK